MPLVNLTDKQLVFLALQCERQVDRVPELIAADIKALARLLRMAREEKKG